MVSRLNADDRRLLVMYGGTDVADFSFPACLYPRNPFYPRSQRFLAVLPRTRTNNRQTKVRVGGIFGPL
jgi:hypothetical protein